MLGGAVTVYSQSHIGSRWDDFGVATGVGAMWRDHDGGTHDPLADWPRLYVHFDPINDSRSEITASMRTGEVIEAQYDKPEDATALAKQLPAALRWALYTYGFWQGERNVKNIASLARGDQQP